MEIYAISVELSKCVLVDIACLFDSVVFRSLVVGLMKLTLIMGMSLEVMGSILHCFER